MENYNTLYSLLADERGFSEKDYNSLKEFVDGMEMEPSERKDCETLFSSTKVVDGMVYLDEEKFVEQNIDQINNIFESLLGEKVITKSL